MEPVNVQLLISTGGVLISGIAATFATGFSSRQTIKLEHRKAHEAWLRETAHEEERNARGAYRQLLIDIDDLDTIITNGFTQKPAYLDPSAFAAERKLKAQVATVLLLISDRHLDGDIMTVSERMSYTLQRTQEATILGVVVEGSTVSDHKRIIEDGRETILKAFRKDLHAV